MMTFSEPKPGLASDSAPRNLGAAQGLKPRTLNTVTSKILVVDDEPEAVRGLILRLAHAGYQVIAAQDGITATNSAVREQPDLIILDIGMPCGDGHIVAQRLADNLRTLFIPIIFLTARTAQLDRDRAKAVGAVGFITKPFTTDELLEAVELALNPKAPD